MASFEGVGFTSAWSYPWLAAGLPSFGAGYTFGIVTCGWLCVSVALLF
jgi:hypothetical protein